MPRRNPSEHINRKAAARLHHAFRFLDVASGRSVGGEKLASCARSQNLDLNLFITINYGNTTLGDRFDELRSRRFAPWLRRACARLGLTIQPTYTWVRENAGGIPHAHWAVHVPRQLEEEFKDLLPRWVASLDQNTAGRKRRSISFAPAPEAVVQVKPVKDTVGLRKYFLKGVGELTKRFFGIKQVSDQGMVFKRRSGYSRNLCPTALKRKGYKPRPVPPSVSPSSRAYRLAKYRLKTGLSFGGTNLRGPTVATFGAAAPISPARPAGP
jgi:hypothetical protein